MLFSKNLIAQNTSVETYNSFVNQINNMQKNESNALNKELGNTLNVQNNIDERSKNVEKSEDYLISKIKLLDVLLYYFPTRNGNVDCPADYVNDCVTGQACDLLNINQCPHKVCMSQGCGFSQEPGLWCGVFYGICTNLCYVYAQSWQS